MNAQSIQQQQNGVPGRRTMEYDRFLLMNEATQTALGDVLGWQEETEVPSFFSVRREDVFRLNKEYQDELIRVFGIEMDPNRFHRSISSESFGITLTNGKPRPPRTFVWDAWRKEYNRRRIQGRCLAVKEELVAAAWHPRRMERWIEIGGPELLDALS